MKPGNHPGKKSRFVFCGTSTCIHSQGKRQKPSSQHLLQLLPLPLKSCHISGPLFAPSAWYPKGCDDDQNRRICFGYLDHLQGRNVCCLFEGFAEILQLEFTGSIQQSHVAFKRGHLYSFYLSFTYFVLSSQVYLNNPSRPT